MRRRQRELQRCSSDQKTSSTAAPTLPHLPTREKQDVLPPNRGCLVRKMIAGRWGPYLYSVTKKNGKQTWKYLGKVSGLVRQKETEGESHTESDQEAV